MLKKYDIKNIVSVDDKWFTPEKLEEIIRAQGIEEEISLKEYCSIYEIDVSENEKKQFRELQNESLKDLDKIKNKIPETYPLIIESLSFQQDTSLMTLEAVLDRLAEDRQFNVCKEFKFSANVRKMEGNTLYILDKDMGGDQEDGFLEYIVSIIEVRKETRDLIIVYSNEVSGLLTHEQKVEYLKSKNRKAQELSILYQFWPISKITDEKKLIEQMTEMTSKSVYGKALGRMVEVKQLSINQALEELIQIDINNLDNMIIDSYIEGEKITDTYEGLIDSLIKKNTSENLLSSDWLSYEKELLRYEAERGKRLLVLEGVETNKKYNKFRRDCKKKKVLESANKKVLHYSIADYSVNKRYENPNMGDIYLFTESKNNKEYAGLLISQQCNMVIRKDDYTKLAKRKDMDFLILLYDKIEINEDSVNKEDKGNKLDAHIWPIKIDEKMYLLKSIGKSIYIDSALMDLCGLNSEGTADSRYDATALNYKSAFSQEFYCKFKDDFQKRLDDIGSKAIRQCGIDKDNSNIRNMAISLTFGIVYDNTFSLRRICRLDEKRTLHIIHEYLGNIGRIGVSLPLNM